MRRIFSPEPSKKTPPNKRAKREKLLNLHSHLHTTRTLCAFALRVELIELIH